MSSGAERTPAQWSLACDMSLNLPTMAGAFRHGRESLGSDTTKEQERHRCSSPHVIVIAGPSGESLLLCDLVPNLSKAPKKQYELLNDPASENREESQILFECLLQSSK